MLTKKKILLFADWYEPGFRAGGPIRSVVNFVQNMKEDYAIYVFTADRDLDASQSYENISKDEWIATAPEVQCYYCSPEKRTRANIREQLNTILPDFIYLNSMFSTWSTIIPLMVARMDQFAGKIILTPRGMLRESALRFKPLKKQLFLLLFRMMGFSRRINFQATDDTEVRDVRKYFGPDVMLMQLSNFPAPLTDPPPPILKQPGILDVLFVGRIHPIKNLYFLLQAIRDIRSRLRLSIVGAMEDPSYWQECKRLIGQLPENITVNYMGEMPNQDLPPVFAKAHIFALPTKGENFGHAIFEALGFGKPVLISDQTPWRQLESEKVGWDLSLNGTEKFKDVLEQVLGWDQKEYNVWSENAFNFAKKRVDRDKMVEEYRKLFA